LIPWLEPSDPFPPVSRALAEPAGLLAASDDLTCDRLIAAYRRGIFPWSSAGQPVLWWSTDPRMVLFTDEFRVSQSLRKTLVRTRENASIEVRCDSAFDRVIAACAAPRPGQHGTWITGATIDAYVGLHRLGLAHSVETWRDGALLGGLYGVSLGRMFYGESMFTRATDASKIALAALVHFLRAGDFPMIDCQQETSHLATLGARPIRRDDFIRRLRELIDQPAPRDWPKRLEIAVAR
jgi:leucyl/phenylalanyl-tRNA--protein transferase